MDATIKRNEQFDYIRAISVVMVILHHCVDNYVTITADASIIIRLTIVLLHTCHVPFFLIVAGYFCHEQSILGFYKKKFQKILIPFVFFSLLKLIYSAFVSNEFAHGGDSIFGQFKYSFLIGRQYWFIYTILGIYIIAPLFWTKANKEQSNSMIWLFVSYITVCIIAVFGINVPELFQIDHIINYLPYFIFGCVLRQKQTQIISIAERIDKKISMSIAIFLILSFLATYIYYPAIRNYPVRFLIAVLAFFIIFEGTKSIKGNAILGIVSKYSLQVMFFDGIFRTIIFSILSRIKCVNILTAIITSVLVIVFSVLSCKVIERIPIVKTFVGI